jgi:SRSO17 transposase
MGGWSRVSAGWSRSGRRKYITALMSDLPRDNWWTIAEHAGDATPDRTQRLLNQAVWDTDEAMSVVRRFVAGHLADELVVGALDESGQQKQGAATAGVKRQYMGCAGRVANGVKTVYCTHDAISRNHFPDRAATRFRSRVFVPFRTG